MIKSREFLFLFDGRDCVPNGEREPGLNGPRIDVGSARAVITDVCLKRSVRDFFFNVSRRKNEKILNRREMSYCEDGPVPLKDSLFTDLDIAEGDLKGKSTSEINNLLASRFIDYRLFGAILNVGKDLVSRTGPVQIETTKSLNIPHVIQLQISSVMASDKQHSAGALGTSVILDYAAFLTHGIIKQSLGNKTGAVEEDAARFFTALWNGLKVKQTRTKFNQIPRLLISLVMTDQRTQVPMLRKSISLTSEFIPNFQSCILKVDELANLIAKFAGKIEVIEFMEDPWINLQINAEQLKSIRDLPIYVANCPPMVPLEI